jgi:hypothetical protein
VGRQQCEQAAGGGGHQGHMTWNGKNARAPLGVVFWPMDARASV